MKVHTTLLLGLLFFGAASLSASRLLVRAVRFLSHQSLEVWASSICGHRQRAEVDKSNVTQASL